jgi:hypothetical protein
MTMKDVFNKSIAGALVVAFIVPASFAFMPKKAEAQQGKISACVAGLLTAIGVSTPAFLKDTVGVSTGHGGSVVDATDTGNSGGISFNSCILQPLAKIMIITLIRQIGASVVDWVNNGFEGKPSFVTDFEGTLRDAADNALGEFIEGSELGWLCSNFSFQIRIALAMKYSKPWKRKAQCTLTKINQNIDNFVQNNGGAGWDNWLEVTSEPQNNWIGAYYMADSELAARMMKATDIKEKRITMGAGFLDFETCDDWETDTEAMNRAYGTQGGTSNTVNTNTFGTQGGTFNTVNTNTFGTQGGTSNAANTNTFNLEPAFAPADLRTNDEVLNTKFETTLLPSSKPKCKKSSTKTPGTIIAGKLNSTFMQGDIQAAVAQEIDDVIAATLNQIAKKMMTGAMGLLGLSKKKGGSNVNYGKKYEALYWGGQTPTSTEAADTGAQSEMDAYRNETSDFNATQNLINTNSDTVKINQYTDQKAQEAYNQQQEQLNNITDQFTGVVDASERNVALGKTATQSTTDASAMNAVNGITTEGSNTVSKPASTHQVTADEALYSGNAGDIRPWWQVDLGRVEKIKEVRIYPAQNKPVNVTLETFTITLSNNPTDASASPTWTSDVITGTANYPIKIAIPATGAWRYARITKNAKKDTSCYNNPASYQSAACYHALELAEVEVIVPLETTNLFPGTASTSTSSGTNTVNGDSGKLVWTTNQNNIQISKGNLVSFNQTLSGANKSNLTITTTLYEGTKNITFGSLFSVLTVGWGNGSTERNSMTFDSTMTHGALKLTNVSTTNASQFFLKYNGLTKTSTKSGTYRMEAIVTDGAGNNLGTLSTQFVIQ